MRPIALVCLAGCLTEGNHEITIEVEGIAFAIDIAAWAISEEQARALVQTECITPPTICGALVSQVCPGPSVCSSTCGVDHHCELHLDFQLRREVDIIAATPELATFGGTLEPTIEGLRYEVPTNTLDLDTPPLDVSVATAALTDIHRIGGVERVPEGTTVSEKSIELSDDGKARLAAAITKYRSPFNLVLGSRLTVRRTDPIPSGRLDLVLALRARTNR